MSGSSGGGGGRSISDEEIACEYLKFEAQIASPVPATVIALKVNDVLAVTVANTGGTQQVQVYNGAQLVGGLLANRVSRLRECILNDSTFKATVLSINGGQVRVVVEHE